MNIVIAGAGTFGREVLTWFSSSSNNNPKHMIRGFIDNVTENKSIIKNNYPDTPFLGTLDSYTPEIDDKLIVALLDIDVRKKYISTLKEKGAKFYSFIHSSVIIGSNVIIGEGCVISPNCILSNDSMIGDFVTINTGSTVGHDTVVGNFTSINPNVSIMGNVHLGNECIVGVGSVLINKISIGNNVTVGAGSVVIRSYKNDLTLFGNPAKKYLKQ